MENTFYVNCDKLENIPEPNKDNWLAETELLKKEIRQNAKVLQVGCMDGKRIISLMKIRPDLLITGLDIEKSLINIAKDNLKTAHLKAELIKADITKPLSLSDFDYVICLNNTLGYITDEKKAIDNMKVIGKKVILSVYGEKFTDDIALAYFKSIGLIIQNIKNNSFSAKDFGSIKRYARNEVNEWGGEITKIPIGYFCVI